MKVSTLLDHIDSGHMALPEFQRGYVWNRDQVRGLIDWLYRRHPVGSLLVWTTEADGTPHKSYGQLAPGVVKFLLDGQQRITSGSRSQIAILLGDALFSVAAIEEFISDALSAQTSWDRGSD